MKFLVALFGFAFCGLFSAELVEAAKGGAKELYDYGSFEEWKDITRRALRDTGYYEGEEFDKGRGLGHNVHDTGLDGSEGVRGDLMKIRGNAERGEKYDNHFNNQRFDRTRFNWGENRKRSEGTPKNNRFYLGNLKYLRDLMSKAGEIAK